MNHASAYESILTNYDVVLVPSYVFAAQLNSAVAHASASGAFGCIAQTFFDWAVGLWERYGDGRIIAPESSTAAALAHSFANHKGELKRRPGLPVSALKMLHRASGLPSFDAALSDPTSQSELLPAEQELLVCINNTKSLLARANLIEFGDACAWLCVHARNFAPKTPLHLAVLGDGPMPDLASHTLSVFKEAGFVDCNLFMLDGSPIEALPAAELKRPSEDIDLRFAFPSGDYATPQLVDTYIASVLADDPGATIAISVREPLKLYNTLAPTLEQQDIRVAVRDSIPFSYTTFGRAYFSLRACLDDELLPWSRSLLQDSLASPINRRPVGATWTDDIKFRANRLFERDAAVADLMKQSGVFALLERLITDPDLDTFNVMEERLSTNSPLEPTELAASHAALAYLKQLHIDGLRFKLTQKHMYDAFLPLLERSHIRVALANYDATPGLAPQVEIMGQYQLAQLPAHTYSSVVMLDLDADSYPVKLHDDACSMLLRKLKVPLGEDPLTAQRRMWSRILAVSTKHLLLGRCLNNADADERYHCAMLEEFIDLYRDDPSQLEDINNKYALPDTLQTKLCLAGEEHLLRDVDLRAPAPSRTPEDSPLTDVNKHIASRRFWEDDSEELYLSPSQIEVYIACPAKWFATRRLQADVPDEVLGFSSQGLFRHDVLQTFYELFRNAGFDKPSEDNREAAQAILDKAFDETLTRHLEQERPKHRAAFMLNTTEKRVLELIRYELGVGQENKKSRSSWLDFEEQLLSPYTDSLGQRRRYIPRAFEFDLSPYNIQYAGARLTGIIDRIDIDKATNSFVVIDYKGSLKSHYNLVCTEDVTPNIANKIQTYIYASALLKSPEACADLGLAYDPKTQTYPQLAATLYVSYLRGNSMRGVFVKEHIPAEVQTQVLPTLPASSKPITAKDFAQVLASVEAQVNKRVVASMLAGDVVSAPSSKDVCKWCSIYGCPRRS